MGISDVQKNVPQAEKINIRKEEAGAPEIQRKELLAVIDEPKAGVASRSFQIVSGRVGNGITKAYLRVNGDTQVVEVLDGKFEALAALKPGVNTLTVLGWDLEGNLGKYSQKVIFKPEDGGPKIELLKPSDGCNVDITENRVIRIEARAGSPVKDAWIILNNIPMRAVFQNGVMRQDIALYPGTNELYVEAEDAKGRSGRSGAVRIDTFDGRPKDLVAVLTWDSATADFDLHVWDSFGHHTFNDAPDPALSDAAIPGGMLDMDRKGDYGPEVFSLEEASPEVYSFCSRYNPGLKEKGAKCYLRLLLHGAEPSRRIIRSFGPYYLDAQKPLWEAAQVKMPEGIFFQDKQADLNKMLGMDSKAVGRLSLMLKEENPVFKLLAISALGQMKNEDAVNVLLNALSSDSPEIRRAAAGALSNIKSRLSVNGLIKALGDPDPEVRAVSAGALGEAGGVNAVPALSTLLGEETDTAVRAQAAKALGKLQEPSALEALVAAMADSDPSVRVEVVRAIGGLKNEPSQVKKIEKAVLDALSDKEPGVREAAAETAGRLKLQKAVKPLCDVLRFDSSDGVRLYAVRALGEIKEKSSLNDLEYAAQKDGSERVRYSAEKAAEAFNGAQIEEQEEELPPVKLDDDVVID